MKHIFVWGRVEYEETLGGIFAGTGRGRRAVMAGGAVGGGGLGTMAIARGYQRSRMDVILVSTVLILIIVFVSQLIFNWLIRKVEH